MIPNLLSLARIVLSVMLLFIKPLSAVFYAVYILCGISDMADGVIARKTGTASKLGEKLDSAADLIMTAILLVIFYPIIAPTVKVIIWIALIGAVRLASMAAAYRKYGTFAILHTYGNKITGLLLFIFPLFIPYINLNILVNIVCTAASISAVEELIIQLTSKHLQRNRKSILHCWKGL